eukprot:gnl/TRDRNA2_/TRDRNA2_30079_c0_seq1.p1 gnl/TRDRNA2_/TRDRNA2_30079_c0~~gnl/TRDRNA2_/TRDRNA2_30079_c0_seq1.p1  ORF type:complete len:374 (-),score=29.62 gnl/TRDRNA2_/TRDRNA2_30079_c0_seq1:28-1149(-)
MTIVRFIILASIDIFAHNREALAFQLAPSSPHEFHRSSATCTPYVYHDENTKQTWSPSHGPFAHAMQKPIDRVNAEDLTPGRFHEQYIKTNRPVVVSGAASNLFVDSPWTVDDVMNDPYANIPQPVKTHQLRLSAHEKTKMTVPEIFAHPGRAVHFEPVVWSSLTQEKLHPRRMHLKKDFFAKFRNSTFLQHENLRDKRFIHRTSFNLHLSNQGGAIPHSHQSTLNVLLHGAKRWIMVNPMDYRSDADRAAFETIDDQVNQRKGTSSIRTSQSWFMQNASDWIENLSVPYHDFVLHEGDAIFIPNFWTHGTMDLCRETIGVELMGSYVHSGYKPEWTKRYKFHGVASLHSCNDEQNQQLLGEELAPQVHLHVF